MNGELLCCLELTAREVRNVAGLGSHLIPAGLRGISRPTRDIRCHHARLKVLYLSFTLLYPLYQNEMAAKDTPDGNAMSIAVCKRCNERDATQFVRAERVCEYGRPIDNVLD
jgi:hypothetical protein